MAEDEIPAAGGETGGAPPAVEADLLDRLCGGEVQAGHRFVRDCYPAVYRYLLYLTGRRETAEDLTQGRMSRGGWGAAELPNAVQPDDQSMRPTLSLGPRSYRIKYVAEWVNTCGAARWP